MTKALESSLDEAKKHGWNGRFDRAIMYGAHVCLSFLWCPAGENKSSLTTSLTSYGAGARRTTLLRRRLLPEPCRRRPRLGRLADVVKAVPELANSR